VTDERVAAAVAHWGPRFVANGVDANDFQRVTAAIERWEDWLPAWVASGDEHARVAREAEAQGTTRTAGEAWNRAALAYHFAKFVWFVDLDRYREATVCAIEALRAAHRHLDPAAERLEIPYDGTRMAANLRRPEAVPRPPLVLLIPGLDSAKEEFYVWESVFLVRGLATLSLDGPGQGETGFSTNIEPAYERPVGAVLDFLERRDDLDLGRVGLAGVSLGGYYAPRAAAYERRVRAAVGVSGPFQLDACWETMPLPTREALIHHTGAADEAACRARAAELSLVEAAPLLDRPYLAMAGRRDRLIPWQQTKRQADEAPGGEFVVFEEGNHVCNNIPYAYRPRAGDWLREKLS
jgi:pimeloyl-ACP methyl ester carboxylesterase